MPKTVAIDFDGVIHSYHLGYHDGSIYGHLIAGARRAIKELQETCSVFVFTARNVDDVAKWLVEQGVPALADGPIFHPLDRWQDQDIVFVTNRKLIASVYVDDRALRFVHWQQTLDELRELLQ